MKISFSPSMQLVEDVVDSPRPAKLVVPQWYKKTPVSNLKNLNITDSGNHNSVTNLTLKSCMPFLDALTSGYIQTTWTDIYVGQKEGNIIYHGATPPAIMNHRTEVSIEINTNDYYPIEYTWHTHWRAKLPKGYSLLITHPFNRLDLPFTTLSAIVDADLFNHTTVGNIPFFIRRDFQGIIPAGTPMYQLIPIKRDSWEKEIEKFNDKEVFKKEYLMRSRFYNAYRDMFWQKKNYN